VCIAPHTLASWLLLQRQELLLFMLLCSAEFVSGNASPCLMQAVLLYLYCLQRCPLATSSNPWAWLPLVLRASTRLVLEKLPPAQGAHLERLLQVPVQHLQPSATYCCRLSMPRHCWPLVKSLRLRSARVRMSDRVVIPLLPSTQPHCQPMLIS
jgi:hypothetical protein